MEDKYEIYYEGELSADNLNAEGVRQYFKDCNTEFETDKAAGYYEDDQSFYDEDSLEYFQVVKLVDIKQFL